MKPRFALVALSLIGLISLSNAQHATVRGSIFSKSGETLPYADISLKHTVRHIQTDANGHYVMQSITPGIYDLVVSYLGYQTLDTTITLAPDAILTYDLVLGEASILFDEVHITAIRGDKRHLQEVDGYAINATKKNELVQLDRIDANLAMNTSRQIFNKVPGIMIWESDGSGIQASIGARGLSPNRSWEFNTRLNGYDVTPDPMGYPEAYYTPPAEVVDRIEIIRGAASLQYGPQMGGLVNYILRKPDMSKKWTIESMNTIGSKGLFSTFNYLGGTNGKWSYTAYYQKRRGDGWRQNSAFDSDHAHLQLSYAATEKLRVGLEMTYMDYVSQQAGGLTDSLFKIDAAMSLRARNWFSAPWLIPALTAEYIHSKNSKVSFKAFGTLGERNSVGFTKAINIVDDLSTRQVDRDLYKNIGTELRWMYEFTMGKHTHTVATGLRYFSGHTDRLQLGKGSNGTDYDITIAEGSTYNRDLDFDNQNVAAFTEAIFRLTDRFLATAGLRYEFIQSNATGRIEFKDGQPLTFEPLDRTRQFVLVGGGLEYHTSPLQEFYTNLSQAYRPVLFSDLTPPATTDVIDPQLSDASGWNFDIGYRGRLQRGLSFDIDYFHLTYNNRIGTIAQIDSDQKIYNLRTNLGTSISQGVEAYLEVRPLEWLNLSRYGKLSLSTTLAYVDASYGDFKVTSVSNGAITKSNLRDKQVENAPKYIRRYAINYSYKTYSITWQMSDIGEAFANASNTASPNATATSGLIPAYKVQDLSTSAKIRNHYILKAGVNNLSDARYFTRRAGGYPGPGLLPADGRTLYVSVGIKF
jgi:Fe(3+) dicitrate transport protein